MTAGQRIKQLREEHGMTLEQVAAKVHLQKKDIMDAEAGRRTLSRKQLEILGRAFGVNPDYLAGKVDDPTIVAPAPKPKPQAKEEKPVEAEPEKPQKSGGLLANAFVRRVQYLYIGLIILGAVGIGLLFIPYHTGLDGSLPTSFFQLLGGEFQHWFSDDIANMGVTFTFILFLGLILEIAVAAILMFMDVDPEYPTFFRTTTTIIFLLSLISVVAMILTSIGLNNISYTPGAGAYVTPCIQLLGLAFPIAYTFLARREAAAQAE